MPTDKSRETPLMANVRDASFLAQPRHDRVLLDYLQEAFIERQTLRRMQR